VFGRARVCAAKCLAILDPPRPLKLVDKNSLVAVTTTLPSMAAIHPAPCPRNTSNVDGEHAACPNRRWVSGMMTAAYSPKSVAVIAFQTATVTLCTDTRTPVVAIVDDSGVVPPMSNESRTMTGRGRKQVMSIHCSQAPRGNNSSWGCDRCITRRHMVTSWRACPQAKLLYAAVRCCCQKGKCYGYRDGPLQLHRDHDTSRASCRSIPSQDSPCVISVESSRMPANFTHKRATQSVSWASKPTRYSELPRSRHAIRLFISTPVCVSIDTALRTSYGREIIQIAGKAGYHKLCCLQTPDAKEPVLSSRSRLVAAWWPTHPPFRSVVASRTRW
jgi:hypothetical protein